MAPLLRTAVALVALIVGGCATAGNDAPSKLVGTWRSQNGAQTAQYVFAGDGTFTGTVAANGRVVSDFTGRWSLKEGAILYDYTGDKLGSIPAGTKDRDKLLSIGPDRFMIEAADGSKRQYVRAGAVKSRG